MSLLTFKHAIDSNQSMGQFLPFDGAVTSHTPAFSTSRGELQPNC